MVLKYFTKKYFYAQFRYEEKLIEIVRTIPGSTWDKDKKMYKIPVRFRNNLINILNKENEPYHCEKELLELPAKKELLKGFIITKNYDMSKLPINCKIYEGHLYENISSNRTKKMLEEDVFKVFIVKEIPPKFQPRRLFPILKAINHELGVHRSWFEFRYCDWQKQGRIIYVNGFTRKDEFFDRIRNVINPEKIKYE